MFRHYVLAPPTANTMVQPIPHQVFLQLDVVACSLLVPSTLGTEIGLLIGLSSVKPAPPRPVPLTLKVEGSSTRQQQKGSNSVGRSMNSVIGGCGQRGVTGLTRQLQVRLLQRLLVLSTSAIWYGVSWLAS